MRRQSACIYRAYKIGKGIRLKSKAVQRKVSVKVACLISTLLVLGFGGCGSPKASGTSPVDITITWQPVSQSTPLGQTATFNVIAQGNSPLSYQWIKNGKAISGATSNTYTTSPTSSSDNGAVYSVTVADASGSLVSVAATLEIGPRSPRSDDLRFKGVDIASTLPLLGKTNVIGMMSTTISGALDAPLQVGDAMCVPIADPTDCSWNLLAYETPTEAGFTSAVTTDLLSNLSSDLSAINFATTVITSLDEHPANNVFALSSLSTAHSSGFTGEWHNVTSDNLQASASEEGAKGRVITAISVNALGQFDYVSYGWQSDSFGYEVSIIFSANDTVESQAAGLASQGYILTAVGRSGLNDGFILVGTRVQGDSLSRPFALNQDFVKGYAVVGYVFDSNGNTFFGEK